MAERRLTDSGIVVIERPDEDLYETLCTACHLPHLGEPGNKICTCTDSAKTRASRREAAVHDPLIVSAFQRALRWITGRKRPIKPRS